MLLSKWLPCDFEQCSIAIHPLPIATLSYGRGYPTGLPAVREKSGKKIIFQGQGKVREFCKKSGKIFRYGKVREKSGNFVMNARNTFFISPTALWTLNLVPRMDSDRKILASFWCYVLFPPYISLFPKLHIWRKYTYTRHNVHITDKNVFKSKLMVKRQT